MAEDVYISHTGIVYFGDVSYVHSIKNTELKHYGVGHLKGGHSGRYAWGSGENPQQRAYDFLKRVDDMRKSNLTFTDDKGTKYSGDTAIAKSMGLTTTQFRAQLSKARIDDRRWKVAEAEKYRNEGKSYNEIAKLMGYENDSSVRSLLDQSSKARMNATQATVDFLRKEVETKGLIDVGKGVERELGVSRTMLNNALTQLEVEGYPTYKGRIPQATNKTQFTTQTVLGSKESEYRDIYDFDKVKTITDYRAIDGGVGYRPAFQYPSSLDGKRVAIRYAEDGGIKKDGVIEIRRGVKDLDLGECNYAQVRIMVDNDRYLKGMAVYSDNLPDGVDVLFNTNKKVGTPMRDVLKPIKDDPDNPFGALLREKGGQSYYEDPHGKFVDPETGKKMSLSPINKTRIEGDWGEWSKKLPSQFLAKQSIQLIKRQLNMDLADKKAELAEINSLTIPAVKKTMLMSFADDCDAAAVHLQAASLPRQRYQVILPLTSLKDNEVYAPNYKTGETLALVRFPHGGTFEIPIVTVNNRNKEGRASIGSNAIDAIGINSSVAERLSGADFDGDTVMVIPTNDNVKIKSTKPLRGLEGFDPKLEYPERPGMTYMKYKDATGKEVNKTQLEMGKISNLITDMTIKGATSDELARAVRHSMVVIDAGKHKLDYKRSEDENGIAELKKLYQSRIDPETGRESTGASTLLSRAKSPVQVTKKRGTPKIDPDTGELIYKEANEFFVDPKTGKTRQRMQDASLMEITKDANRLSTGTPQENEYARYANACKALANDARKAYVSTPRMSVNPEAKAAYADQVKSLNAKLDAAERNAPKEREAQRIANSIIKAKKDANPDMTKAEVKKESQRALADARLKVGASGKASRIRMTDKEWEAVLAGAISESKLASIANHSDKDELRQRATPRTTTELSSAKVGRLRAYARSGYTNAEIAKILGISTSAVSKYINS